MGRLAALALALTILAAAGGPAAGQTREEGPWWPHPLWGPDDQAGGSNWITPEVVLRAARLVETGKVYELGQVYELGMPLFGQRTYALSIPGSPTGGPFGENNQLVYFDDFLCGEIGQIGTQFDGLAHIGARSVGMASRVLELARNHAAERRQFGQAIGEFQMVQKMLADMATDIFAARMMTLNTAWELDQGRDPRDKLSMVKVYASEMMNRVADQGIQIFGGMGWCKELPLERVYRDSRVLRIYDGTSEIHRMLIARNLLRSGFALEGDHV